MSYNLTEIGQWAHAVGPQYNWVMDEPELDTLSKFVEQAHGADLAVHPYTC
jgi:glycerophosphoryl diester phosphodiesterase